MDAGYMKSIIQGMCSHLRKMELACDIQSRLPKLSTYIKADLKHRKRCKIPAAEKKTSKSRNKISQESRDH